MIKTDTLINAVVLFRIVNKSVFFENKLYSNSILQTEHIGLESELRTL
jgi:hypothetical protein